MDFINLAEAKHCFLWLLFLQFRVCRGEKILNMSNSFRDEETSSFSHAIGSSRSRYSSLDPSLHCLAAFVSSDLFE